MATNSTRPRMIIAEPGLEESVRAALCANHRNNKCIQILHSDEPRIIIHPKQDPIERHAYLVVNGEVCEFIPGYEGRASENRIFPRGSIVFPQALHRQYLPSDYPVAYETTTGTDLIVLTIEIAAMIGISCETIAALAEVEHRTIYILAETRKRLILQEKLVEVGDGQVARIHSDFCQAQIELNRARMQLDETRTQISETNGLLEALQSTQSELSETRVQLAAAHVELASAQAQIRDLDEMIRWDAPVPTEGHVDICVEEKVCPTQVGLSPPTQEDEPSRVDDDIESTDDTDATASEDDSDSTPTVPPPPKSPSLPTSEPTRKNTMPFGMRASDGIADPTNHDFHPVQTKVEERWPTPPPPVVARSSDLMSATLHDVAALGPAKPLGEAKSGQKPCVVVRSGVSKSNQR